jgi:hypothetical protein
MAVVYWGQRCRGFILSRGRDGFEAYADDEKSLGLYRDQLEAIAAISAKTGAAK